MSFGPSLFPRHDDRDPLAKAKEGGRLQMKRNWFTGRESGIGHLSLRFHLCSDSDSSCHSLLELLSMKENCQITVICAGRRRCCTSMNEGSDFALGRLCCMDM